MNAKVLPSLPRRASIRTGLKRLAARLGPWAGPVIFMAGLLFYGTVQLGLLGGSIQVRRVPVETDDAYTYILKAVQMQSCFRQDCPALNDLRQQLTAPTSDPKAEWLRYREYGRAFLVYHPLHSLLLLLLNGLGLSWEAGYNLLVLAGGVLIGLGVAVWLLALFGPGPAGLALFLTGANLFSGQGLHYVVPSNLALGIALLTWAAILPGGKPEAGRRQKLAGLALVLGTLAMVLLHSTGRLYAGLALLLFCWRSWPLRRRELLPAALSLALIGLAFLLPLIVTRPDLAVQPDPPLPDWNIWMGYGANLKTAGHLVGEWTRLYAGFLPAVALSVIGLLSLAPPRRPALLVQGLLLAALLAASLAFVLPRYPAEAFSRIWIAAAILLTGLVAQAAWAWLGAFAAWLGEVLDRKLPALVERRWLLSPAGWTLAGLLVLGAGLVGLGAANLYTGLVTIQATEKIMATKQDVTFDPAQPALLLARGCRPVLYLDEAPMHFYFSRGALACGAVYAPGVEGTPERRTWIGKNPDLGYLVAWNPAAFSSLLGGGRTLSLDSGDRLEIHLPAGEAGTIAVYLDNPGAETRLAVYPPGESQSEAAPALYLPVPAGSSGWQTIVLEDELSSGLVLQAPTVRLPVRIQGVRLRPEAALNWPWDEGVSLVYVPAGPNQASREISFASLDLYPRLDRPFQILSDSGDTVLAEILK